MDSVEPESAKEMIRIVARVYGFKVSLQKIIPCASFSVDHINTTLKLTLVVFIVTEVLFLIQSCD